MPLGQAIAWVPRGAEHPGGAVAWPENLYPLFIEHDVVAGVNRHLDRREREPRFGFLLGRLYRCPEREMDFAVADTAVAAREVLSEEASGACLIRAWSEAQAVFSGHSGLLLGWYHSHYRLGLMPSQADLETNARYFEAPWQLSIVVVPDRARPLGGVFRHGTTAGGAAGSRPRPTPFYEILPEPHGGDIGGSASSVSWANYEARQPAPPAFYPAAGGGAHEEGEAAEPPGSEPPPRREPPTDPPSPADPPPASEPPERERPPAQPVKKPPRGTGGPEHPANVPLVIPGEKKGETGLLPPRSRRIAWPVVVAGVLVVAAALFVLLPDGLPTRDGPVRSAASGERGPSPEIRRFLERVDTVEIAGERYAERAADFDAGRIGCDLLTTGYVAADDAYVEVSAAYRELASRSNSRVADAYETADREIAQVNDHFDESGCPRP